MSAAGLDHRQARLHIGADPRHLPPEVLAHVDACAECRRFRDETLTLDARLHAALELPLERFRKPVAPARRYALAASVALALLVAGGAWLLRPSTALASEVTTHVEHEPDSWNATQPLAPGEVADVLRTAQAQFDSPYPVVYGYPCPFKDGQRVAHLVLQTPNGKMTVMLIPHEQARRRTELARDGMRGVLLPAGKGSVALLTRDGQVPEAVAEQIVSRVRY
jgi:hypothetical protein